MAPVRAEATILHVDLDAFFASVEQRDKPSLRGKPVIVGGTGPRGVVATASYEARRFGVGSAMAMSEARRRCPHAAYLSGRFPAYHRTSRVVMELLRALSPLVEPLSLDEAYVDLAATDLAGYDVSSLTEIGREIKTRITEATGGLTASVGIGTSKLVAKIASDLDKPDGLVVVAPGTEADLLAPMNVRVIPGVGPATAERLAHMGVETVSQLRERQQDELVHALGRAHGLGLYSLARAEDERDVVPDRETKSISVEDTYETDYGSPRVLESLLDRQSAKVGERLRRAGLSGRTVTVKVRLHDFTTFTRSATLPEPVDDTRTIARLARSLLGEVDTSAGVRLLGVGVSSLADWVQDDLFTNDDATIALPEEDRAESTPMPDSVPTSWRPGMDVVHNEWGRGWVWGSGHGVVTVRFETATTGPGPVRSFATDDPALSAFQYPAESEG
jgi:DNA polymerase-4